MNGICQSSVISVAIEFLADAFGKGTRILFLVTTILRVSLSEIERDDAGPTNTSAFDLGLAGSGLCPPPQIAGSNYSARVW